MDSLPLVLPFSCSTPTVPPTDLARQIAEDNFSSYFTLLGPVSVKDLNDDERNNVLGILLTGGFTQDKVKLDGETMDMLPNLRAVSTPSTGINHIDVDAALKRGIRVGHSPGHLMSESVADMAFSLLFAAARNIVMADKVAKSEELTSIRSMRQAVGCGTDVTGATIGIVGLGHIGSAVAERARGFKMEILYHSRTQNVGKEKSLGTKFCSSLEDLLCKSDFIVICVPLTAETNNLITCKELNKMKPTAILINVARGAVVNPDDLCVALQNGVIKAAGLDVTEPLPLPRDHPLLKMANVSITPHQAVYTHKTILELTMVSMENLKAGVQGLPLPYPVN